MRRLDMLEALPPRPPRDSILITDCSDGRKIPARIGRLTPAWARRLIISRWWREVSVPLARSSLESDHAWAWDRYAAEAEVDPNSRCYVALTAYERRLEAQGAIIYRIDAASLLEPGRRAVYLHFLASAPRNRSLLMKGAAVYRGVGEGLVLMAMLDSLYNGLEGRVLGDPVPDAIPFYEKLHFRRVLDPQDHRVYYEIP
jgi:hypothetical protein